MHRHIKSTSAQCITIITDTSTTARGKAGSCCTARYRTAVRSAAAKARAQLQEGAEAAKERKREQKEKKRKKKKKKKEKEKEKNTARKLVVVLHGELDTDTQGFARFETQANAALFNVLAAQHVALRTYGLCEMETCRLRVYQAALKEQGGSSSSSSSTYTYGPSGAPLELTLTVEQAHVVHVVHAGTPMGVVHLYVTDE